MATAVSGNNSPVTSLIFPMYNPGSAVKETWENVYRFTHESPGTWEVLFVCDGCTDDSPQMLADLTEGAGDSVRIIRLEQNQGKGFAVKHGLQEAIGKWRIFTDVDLSYGLDGVRRVAEKLWSGEDVTVGSRLLPDSSFVIPARLQDYAYRRRIQSFVFSNLVRLLLPLRLTDTQAGLKGFSATAVQNILPHLDCAGFSFDCQLLLICNHLGYAIPEVPVQFEFFDEYSTTHFRQTIRMVRDLFRIRKWYRQFKKKQPDEEPAKQLRKCA